MLLPGRPDPTTFEYVEMIALREPQRLALVQDNSSWNYHELHADLARAIRVLHETGVRRGDRVAVGMSGFQAGLLLLLACESLGAATLSFLPKDDPDGAHVFAHVDWVFSDFAQEPPAHVRFVAIDDEFVKRIAAAEPADAAPLPCAPLAFDEPQRISRTSGSTGRSKFMVLKRQAQEWWIRRSMTTGTLRPDSRTMLLGSLVLNANLVAASAGLRMGAAALQFPRAALAAHDITHILGLPSMIEQVLDSLPPGYSPRVPVDVTTTGGFQSAPLRERATRAFGGRMRNRYGANETGGICEDMDTRGTGVLGAGVDVRIVDEAGRELPQGRIGVIAVRTPGMAEEYIGEPEVSKAAFRDGWFYSGDWGTLVGPRTLQLAGRHDDLVNAGGIKVPAATVESRVRELVHPADCAVLAVNLDAGATTLGIALVCDTNDRDGTRRSIANGLDLGAALGARVIFLERLPRTDIGKIDRVALHAMFQSPPRAAL